MSILKFISTVSLSLLGVATAAGAQGPPPVRPLGPVERTTTDRLLSVATAVQMPMGRVLVNDITGRRVLMFDSTLANPIVVADTTGVTANAYGLRPGSLIRFRGDSALYIDISSLSMFVISPDAKIGRVIAVPRPNEAQTLIGSIFGTPGFDADGRLVYYRSAGLVGYTILKTGSHAPPGTTPLPSPDTAFIVRADLVTHAVDTIGALTM